MNIEMYSPKEISLLLFKSKGTELRPLEDSFPRNEDGSSEVKYQRMSYRKTLNLIMLSFENLNGFISSNNLCWYFPNFSKLMYYFANDWEGLTKSMKLTTPLFKHDAFQYDLQEKWTPLEAILINFTLNSLRDSNHSSHYLASFRWKKELLNDLDYDKFFGNQLNSDSKKRAGFKKHYAFLESEISSFENYMWWLLRQGHQGMVSPKESWFESIDAKVKASVDRGDMDLTQITSMKADCVSPDELVQKIGQAFATDVVTWDDENHFDFVWDNENYSDFVWDDDNNYFDFEWDEKDFDWSWNPDEIVKNWAECTIDEWIDQNLEPINYPYRYYSWFVKKHELGKTVSTSGYKADDGKIFDSGLYKWLTATHLLKLILIGMIMPGLLEVISVKTPGRTDPTHILGFDTIDAFHKYLDGLLGYGKTFSVD